VRSDRLPSDVIAMNSVVRLRDLDTNETETYTIVFPQDADVSRQRISIFAPVGTALLGYREGDVIEWTVPAGSRRLKVEEVLSQPDYAGVHR
jgi:regulator of nucleoside diphosphate kinase